MAGASKQSRIVDDFADVSNWTPIASGLAQLNITRDDGPHGHAMRLDFDFKGGGGFVVARKETSLSLPSNYAFSFDVRAEAPSNKFELKLADPSNRNVWWYREPEFDCQSDWREVRIRSSEIEFAWGPAGAGPMTDVGAVELAITAGLGGKGTVWISNLRFIDESRHPQPLVRASSAARGHAPRAAVDASSVAGWRSATSDEAPWISLDLRKGRELGGLVIEWDPAAPPRSVEVETSIDANTWTMAYSAAEVRGACSYVYLPKTTTRFLRLTARPRSLKHGVGIAEISIEPFEFSRTIDAFFRNVAQRQRRGRYPKYLYAEQSYWSPVGSGDGHGCALLNEEGMIEIDLDSCSLEPFLFFDDTLVTWADAMITQELERGFLPIPSSVWRAGSVGLRVTACARDVENEVLYVRYRVRNYRAAPLAVRLFVAVRPFEVTPPWQAWHALGGAEEVRVICYDDGAVVVDGDKTIIPLTPPSAFGAATAAEGAITEYLEVGEVPRAMAVNDAFEYASAALQFDLALAPASNADVYLAVPFGVRHDRENTHLATGSEAGPAAFEHATRAWEDRLQKVGIVLPSAASECVATLRTATAHILLHRDGPALHPGPRRYTRAWIRDGAIMSAALLRTGATAEACEFVRWYAGFQSAQGDVPCAVDLNGPDSLPEHDSHGELIFAVAECFRFTHDRAFLSELWPHVLGAADTIERLRATRLTPEFESGDRRAFHGLLPESVSHEGYLAHPVHAYYDDFWALRGLGDAAELAAALGDDAGRSRLIRLRDELAKSLCRSIAVTIEDRKLDYVPGSVEWADFDPAATTTAMMLLDLGRGVSANVLRHTYDAYLAGFRKRRDGEIDWDKYTAYEIRIIGAFVRLGERAAAHELLDFFLADRRPRAWNQWPEISWRDPKSPGHLGDVPHTWIAAEYVLAVLGMFAYERVEENALVLAAGISEAWLSGGIDVGVKDLPTYYGPLTYSLRRESADVLRLKIEGTPHTLPKSIVVRPPLSRRLRRVEVDGRGIETFDASSVTISQWPAEVVMRTA